jgi:hypothetical protein
VAGKGIQNGDLLRLAEAQFDLFLTSDQSIVISGISVAAEFRPWNFRRHDLRRILAAASLLRSAIRMINVGEFRQLEIP